MKRFFAMLILGCTLATAQSFKQLTATKIYVGGPTLLKRGRLCAIATDGADIPIPFGVGGGGQMLPAQACADVADGALVSPLQLANPSTATATVQYRITVTDLDTYKETKYPHVSLAGDWCGDSTCDWDNYNPNATMPSIPTTVISGPAGAAATIAIGGTTTLPAGSAATVSNSGTSSAAVFHFSIPQGQPGPNCNADSPAGECDVDGTLKTNMLVTDYTWNPQTPLANGIGAMASAKLAAKAIVVIGDSITCCIGPSDINNNPIKVFTRLLQSAYGNGGTGIIPVGNNDGLSIRPEWSASGTWSAVSDLGPTQSSTGAFGTVFVSAGTSSSLTLTLPAATTSVTVMGETTTDSAGCNVIVAGTTVGTVGNSTTSMPTAFSTDVNLGSATSTVTLSPAGPGKCYLYGAGSSAASTGMVVHNLAHGYARSEAWGSNPSAQLAFVDKLSPVPSLAIIDLGVNDSINGTGTTAAQYQSNLQSIITHLKALNAHMSIMLLDNYDVQSPGTLLPQTSVRQIEQALAASNGLAYMSMHDVWQSYAEASALGYINADHIHPSDIGGVVMGQAIATHLGIAASVNIPQLNYGSIISRASTVTSVEDFPYLNRSNGFISGDVQPGVNDFIGGFDGYAVGRTFVQRDDGRRYLMEYQSTDASGWVWCVYPAGQKFSKTIQARCPAYVDTEGNITAAGGSHILYRCTTAGTLPAGSLTTDQASCGAAADTGLRVN